MIVDSTSNVQPRSNALSNKLTQVLSTSYADNNEVRDVLKSLDERKFQNTAETRRWLKMNLQKEVIQSNGDIIQDFGRLAEQVKNIGSIIVSLNQCCEDIRSHVATAHQETTPVLGEASSLLAQQHDVGTKQQLLAGFFKQFLISDDDLAFATTMNDPVDDRFFGILERLENIHRDCQVLLGTENQRLGIELMEQSSKRVNSAFQKLYRWIQREFQSLNLENPQIGSTMRHALSVLAQRASLFESCLSSFADAREKVLTDAFYCALTGNSSGPESGSAAKPIEIHAYDPLRYVGDMLAWAHSATVSEREALEILFVSEEIKAAKGFQARANDGPRIQSEPANGAGFDGRKALEQLVDRDLAGVATSLRQRIKQIIQSHDDTVLVYKIANLINFYRNTFAKILGTSSKFHEMLSDLEKSALYQFRTATQQHAALTQADHPEPPADLANPALLDEALDRLKQFMKSYDTSLIPNTSREADFDSVLDEALEPFLLQCDSMAKRLEEPAASIFFMNCLLATKGTLSNHDFVNRKAAVINGTIEKLAAKLIDYQHASFLHTSGLHPLISALSHFSGSEADALKVAALEPFKPEALIDASRILDDFLPSALMDAVENLKPLRSTKIVEYITAQAAERFCEDFEFVEETLFTFEKTLVQTNDLNNSDGESKSFRKYFSRTASEIRVLLS